MFYHSFPRPKDGQDNIQKGLKILESFLTNGILLVPECVEYQREKNDRLKTPEEYSVVQSRFCLTQIGISKLKAHEKHFGGFHLEFSNDNAYSLGAIPVFYLPKVEPGTSEWSLKKLAASYLYRLYELQRLCLDIQALGKMVENKRDRETVTVNGKDRATEKTRLYAVKAKQLSDVLDMLTMNIAANPDEFDKVADTITARMDAMLGAIKGISYLFYPTDNDYGGKHKDLYYFRQREWRITAGMNVNGKQLDKKLNDDQKAFLMSIDSHFYGKEIDYANGRKRSRIEECSVIPEILCKVEIKVGEKTEKRIEWKPVRQFVERIIVPKEALEKARVIAEQNGFDPALVIDFITTKTRTVSATAFS